MINFLKLFSLSTYLFVMWSTITNQIFVTVTSDVNENRRDLLAANREAISSLKTFKN